MSKFPSPAPPPLREPDAPTGGARDPASGLAEGEGEVDDGFTLGSKRNARPVLVPTLERTWSDFSIGGK